MVDFNLPKLLENVEEDWLIYFKKCVIEELQRRLDSLTIPHQE